MECIHYNFDIPSTFSTMIIAINVAVIENNVQSMFTLNFCCYTASSFQNNYVHSISDLWCINACLYEAACMNTFQFHASSFEISQYISPTLSLTLYVYNTNMVRIFDVIVSTVLHILNNVWLCFWRAHTHK